jgi:hypothetical protein
MPLAVMARGKPLSEEKRRREPTFSIEQHVCQLHFERVFKEMR